MKITIENTEQLIEITRVSRPTQCRVWLGRTESGIPVQLLVLRIAVETNERQDDFQRELKETTAPAPWPLAYPLRMVL